MDSKLKSYQIVDTDNSIYTVLLEEEDYKKALNEPEIARTILKNVKVAGVSSDKSKENESSEAILEECENLDSGSWTKSSTQMFIQLYVDYEPTIASGTLKQKTVFEKISQRLAENDYMFSAKQCASKLTALKRMYKKIKDHNNTSGNDRQTWQYYDQMHEIFSKKPWIKPLSTLSSTQTLNKSSFEASSSNHLNKSSLEASSNHEDFSTPSNKRMKVSSSDKYLQQIMEEKEIARKEKKEYHEAKMKRWDKMNELMEKMISQNEDRY